ncbi:unnamed protein product [Caenorhabditis angaria]|uniref:Aminotransferase class V domain-containing protein n=1 Tax=Caenorhabditis angaria TaxID=860376 RepID=A0A9P1IP53_9PELO|nr:unnamed protein product [Caenorhabditis angaria]CAI5446802.1 unnamed protein product [Caenorhabditis angaria]
MSQRSPIVIKILDETRDLIRNLMQVPKDFEILFMQGGATAQFSAIPMNLKSSKSHADYFITGRWSQKAAEEAEKYLTVHKVFEPSPDFSKIPEESLWSFTISENSAYTYYCANETVHGVEFLAPKSKSLLVADVSSCFLAKPFDFKNHALQCVS